MNMAFGELEILRRRFVRSGFWVCLIIGNNYLAGFEEMAAGGAEAVAFDDSVAFDDGISDADLACGAARAGELGKGGGGLEGVS